MHNSQQRPFTPLYSSLIIVYKNGGNKFFKNFVFGSLKFLMFYLDACVKPTLQEGGVSGFCLKKLVPHLPSMCHQEGQCLALA